MVELTRPECLALLAENAFGRLAVTIGDRPLIRPVNYIFDPPTQSVAFRTASGSKLYALRHANHAAFEIDAIDAPTRTGWSVIIAGITEEVTDPAILRRLDGSGLETWPPGRRTHWVRIRAWTVSGRRIVPRVGISPSSETRRSQVT